MPDEHGRLLDELLELRSMTVAVQRSGEVIVRNHIFAISFSGLPHTVIFGTRACKNNAITSNDRFYDRPDTARRV